MMGLAGAGDPSRVWNSDGDLEDNLPRAVDELGDDDVVAAGVTFHRGRGHRSPLDTVQ